MTSLSMSTSHIKLNFEIQFRFSCKIQFYFVTFTPFRFERTSTSQRTLLYLDQSWKSLPHPYTHILVFPMGVIQKIMSFNTIHFSSVCLSVCLSICLNVSGLFPHIPQTHLHTHFGLNCWGNFKIVSSNIIFWFRVSVCLSVCMSVGCSLISRKL